MISDPLIVPGSLSSALHTIYFSAPGCLRTRSHFNEVGNPPAMPRNSASFKSASSASHFSCDLRYAARRISQAPVRIGRAGHACLLRMVS